MIFKKTCEYMYMHIWEFGYETKFQYIDMYILLAIFFLNLCSWFAMYKLSQISPLVVVLKNILIQSLPT